MSGESVDRIGRRACPNCGSDGTPDETPPDRKLVCETYECPVVIYEVSC